MTILPGDEPDDAPQGIPPDHPFPPEASIQKPISKVNQRVRKPNGNGADHGPTMAREEDPEDIEDEILPAQFSDDALAIEWVARWGKDWKYVPDSRRWYHWEDARWRHCKTDDYFQRARDITRQALLWPGAKDLTPGGKRAVNSATMAGNMVKWIKSDPAVAVEPDVWDRELMLLGVPGGVIDLTVCKAIEPERDQMITRRTAVSPEASKPDLWLEFLKRVTEGDQDLIDYLHRFSGYCMTGQVNEHALAFLYGTGANGKTVFCETLLYIMGDYGTTTGMETLSENKTDAHPAEVATLEGARLVTAEETSSGSRWAEAKIKRLTGGGAISARMLYGQPRVFTPQFTLLIAGNHKPSLRADEAMKRRIHLVPFTVTIPEQDRDRELPNKLRAEAPRIMHWMLEGCAAWRDYGLSPGERIRDYSAKYIESHDILSEWMSDRTEQDPHSAFYEGILLYRDFCEWCEQQSETPWKRRTFSDALIDKGYDTARAHQGRGFKGIKLRIKA